MSGTKLLVALVALCAVIVAVSLSGSEPASEPAQDIGILTDSGEKRLSQLKGKVVLVEMWASWCGPCRMSMPGIQALYEQRHKDGFEVLGVNVGGDEPSVGRQMVKELGITYPTGPPTLQAETTPYSTGSLPSMVLIDKKGMVRWKQTGYSSAAEDEMRAKVDALLKE
jgi:thiol-disulfide isomerase/thioredoxin